MNKKTIIIASLSALIAVVLGAFGAHVLKVRISPDGLKIWKTAVDYQFYHTLALLFVGMADSQRDRLLSAASYSFIFGIIFFSGSLYILAARPVYAFLLGPIAPIGGLLFIAGWICLVLAMLKRK